ncbi:helix-turn-helix transcriptional regulator, partial [Phenylobacterium aquaticum]|uniref:helix-turn-helix transcriptional regulator n=1 Tax=Phenylobacterium aquaticum TaxID=1763816 RepID=UPI0026F14213
ELRGRWKGCATVEKTPGLEDCEVRPIAAERVFRIGAIKPLNPCSPIRAPGLDRDILWSLIHISVHYEPKYVRKVPLWKSNLITGSQIRGARAALRWSAETLARNCDLGIQTIKRLEQFDGVPPSRSSTLMDIRAALEAAGIEFVGTPDDGPGIRFRKPQQGGEAV